MRQLRSWARVVAARKPKWGVDGIEAFRKVIREATAGDNIRVLFSGLDRGALAEGDVISSGAVIY